MLLGLLVDGAGAPALERAEANSKFTDRYFGEEEFRSSLTGSMRRAAFRILRKRHGAEE
ncbi:hypothetical protein [Streptomonospora salina]|uniref:Uncharacterized protein n=1 Tax=Streptomonospora salina TaxID=104205 RepID=A0A841E3L2_9ACTN|nr:hypothetical protein [Streptomonospora salina]MBB5997044.1 hypothetical protein [Streptomonospora salina]